jgi:hypothetical protein
MEVVNILVTVRGGRCNSWVYGSLSLTGMWGAAPAHAFIYRAAFSAKTVDSNAWWPHGPVISRSAVQVHA